MFSFNLHKYNICIIIANGKGFIVSSNSWGWLDAETFAINLKCLSLYITITRRTK